MWGRLWWGASRAACWPVLQVYGQRLHCHICFQIGSFTPSASPFGRRADRQAIFLLLHICPYWFLPCSLFSIPALFVFFQSIIFLPCQHAWLLKIPFFTWLFAFYNNLGISKMQRVEMKLLYTVHAWQQTTNCSWKTRRTPSAHPPRKKMAYFTISNKAIWIYIKISWVSPLLMLHPPKLWHSGW